MNLSLSPKERLRLIKQLSALPTAQFEQILFALNPPSEIISGSTGSQGNRVSDLLIWAEGPTGPTLESVLDLLSEYISLDEVLLSQVPDSAQPKSASKPSTKAAKVTETSSANELVLEFPEGLVPIDSPFYVERPPVEHDCYDAIARPGSLIRIKAPRQMGKTSLMMRIMHHAESLGYRSVRLSFQTADADTLQDLDSFLQWFCSTMTEELDLPDRLPDYWKGTRGVVRRCQRYFEKYLLPEVNAPLVLGLDEVDQVFEHADIATDFFGMLRVWHEEGKTSDRWRNLHMVIVHSKEVYVPLSINRSPFNVGVPVELRELQAPEIDDLIQRHHLTLAAEELKQLVDLVGGHPFLLRGALYELARQRITLEELLTNAPTEGGLYNDHLRRHLLNLEADDALLTAFKEVIASPQSVQIGSTEAFKLNSMGLVKYHGNEVVPLCNLYRQYFRTRLDVPRAS
ncbi:MAG: AAA-like domain-containing protein [Cyanobacteria bacterium P01_C01_bin.120]